MGPLIDESGATWQHNYQMPLCAGLREFTGRQHTVANLFPFGMSARSSDQWLAAMLFNELRIHLSPLTLGDGAPWSSVGGPAMSPRATHLTYLREPDELTAKRVTPPPDGTPKPMIGDLFVRTDVDTEGVLSNRSQVSETRQGLPLST